MSKPKIRRLFFDLEVSPNVALCWSAGWEQTIPYQNIVKERAIICACYKWEGERRVYCLRWDNGDDKQLLQEFVKILESATEVIGHNSDKFDLKWLRTRCAFHGIPMSVLIQGVDTLKISRGRFKFNSNRLDYIGQFLGVGGKEKIEDYGGLWRKVTLENNKAALAKMISYCKRDVVLVEDVFHKLQAYAPVKTHAAVMAGGSKADCPGCASSKVQRRGYRITAAGVRKQIMSCQSCGRNFTAAITKGG